MSPVAVVVAAVSTAVVLVVSLVVSQALAGPVEHGEATVTGVTPAAGLSETAEDPPSTDGSPAEDRAAQLAAGLRDLVDGLNLGDVVDVSTGRAASHLPVLDVAVIELDQAGRPVAAADVLLDDAHPHGLVAAVSEDLEVRSINWRLWDQSDWSAGRTGSDQLPGTSSAGGTPFTAPYPASVFKLMVAYGILREVDRGRLTLDEQFTYRAAGTSCPENGSGTRTVRSWLDVMLTYSSNISTCAMIKRLHELGAVDELNSHLHRLGLTTLRLGGTDPASGGGWDRASITMTGMDTARLLLLVSGGPGTLWRTPAGEPVTTASGLGHDSRQVFLSMLADQALNQALSTTNWCGRAYPAAGIPQRTAERWIDTDTGAMSVPGRTYGPDVRPCNTAAEVVFAHKTGLVDIAGADAGIVTSLPGAPQRHYVVAVFSTLGSRFVDPSRPASVPYTQKLAQLGRGIDALLAA